MCGRPGLAHIVDEDTAIGSDRAAVVHHPYYTPLMAWTRQAITSGALARYQALTWEIPGQRAPARSIHIDFIPQRGRYAVPACQTAAAGRVVQAAEQSSGSRDLQVRPALEAGRNPAGT